MPYLNVSEVETRLEIAALSYPGLCTLIALPNLSYEGRQTHVVRIRGGSRVRRHGLLFIGGQHAREWGSSDILVSLVDELLAAYDAGTGLTFLGKSYTAADVKTIVQNVDLFVYPDVNPDGKIYSQTVFSMWRKNRRPIPGSGAVGADVNRNYAFLWDYRLHMHPNMFDGSWANGEVVISDAPASDVYRGTSPFSEVETQNVRWLLDRYPHIRFFVDVHSYSQLIYYPWGDDQNQGVDPAQSFTNPAYDGQRGPVGGYGEHIRSQDQGRLNALGQRMNGALNAVRGKSYAVGQSYLLYPTCATSTCYAFSRHIADTAKNKLDPFLIEWGTTFQPDYDTEMVNIVHDISAALTELCLAANRVPIVTVSPARLAYGRVRVGTSRTMTVRVQNRGPRAVAISSVVVEPAGAVGWSWTPGSVASLAPGAGVTLSVTFTPTNAGPVPATLVIEFLELGQPLRDVRPVALVAEGCVGPAGACYAPVFEPQSWLACLALTIVLLPVIALLTLFIWVPGIRCTIKQLLFRLQHCHQGNDDSCRTL